jgi:hypothetical protein
MGIGAAGSGPNNRLVELEESERCPKSPLVNES